MEPKFKVGDIIYDTGDIQDIRVVKSINLIDSEYTLSRDYNNAGYGSVYNFDIYGVDEYYEVHKELTWKFQLKEILCG